MNIPHHPDLCHLFAFTKLRELCVKESAFEIKTNLQVVEFFQGLVEREKQLGDLSLRTSPKKYDVMKVHSEIAKDGSYETFPSK